VALDRVGNTSTDGSDTGAHSSSLTTDRARGGGRVRSGNGGTRSRDGRGSVRDSSAVVAVVAGGGQGSRVPGCGRFGGVRRQRGNLVRVRADKVVLVVIARDKIPGKLHTLLRFHFPSINQVVFLGPSYPLRVGRSHLEVPMRIVLSLP
jgi:hypothetical protein